MARCPRPIAGVKRTPTIFIRVRSCRVRHCDGCHDCRGPSDDVARFLIGGDTPYNGANSAELSLAYIGVTFWEMV